MGEPTVLKVRGHAELALLTRSGRVSVTAEERDDVLIEQGAPSAEHIETDSTGRIQLPSAKGGTANLEVRCPNGADIVIGTMSGGVELRGTLGSVRVTTISGNVAVERAEEIDVRAVSSDIEVGRCAGRCSVRTKTGKAVIESAGDTYVSTISGTIQLGQGQRKIRAQTVSGAIRVRTQDHGDVKVQTLSGSVTVAVPDGVRPSSHLQSLSGRKHSEPPEGSDCRIAVRSVSGRIDVVCA